MNQDSRWLREYVQTGSQESFARLVEANVGLVYSAAFRQLRDHQIAEDITQQAFMALAQKAGGLRSGVIPAAWLLVTTRYLATDMQRAEKRRAAREQKAAEMRTNSANLPEHDAWTEVEPLLDEALCSLSATDLYAVTLRYHQAQNLEQVACALGVSPNTAAQRLHRAVGRLRAYLQQRGVAVDSVALGSLMLTYATHPTPAGLAASIIKSADAFHAGAGILTKGATMVLVSSKVKIVTAAAILLLTFGGTATVVYHATRPSTRVVTIAPSGSDSRVTDRINETWRQGFDRAYALQAGQILRRVAPPFIPERASFYHSAMHGSADSSIMDAATSNDSAAIFGFDSQPEWQSVTFEPFKVLGLTKALAGLRSYDFEGMGQLASLRMPGDWVVRNSSTPQQRMAAIEVLLGDEFGKNIRFVPRTVEREVIVATGRLQIHTLPHPPFPNVVDIYLKKRTDQPLSMAAGKIDNFLGDVGELLAIKFVDETTPGDKQFFWRNFIREQDVRGNSTASVLLLNNLSGQLGLQFHSERRSVEVWFVESNAGKIPPVSLK
ncbi:MAG TPA: sigma-70 family RNA polymerase sigma factor [Tepidisphaeraceae bacterium]|jgi:RNA polymerase sigma factor (sigma-70 family)|nr:sigma-70 family RNA polymerase sigma factor [Tepidisphaeraceae bacterium]